MRRLYFLSIFTALFCGSIFAQEASNVQVEATANELIISYDLLGRPATTYEVKLFIVDEQGERIEPKSLNGDVGRVISGDNKRIVWNVYEDVDGLSGSITPDLRISFIELSDNVTLPTPEPPRLVEDVFVEDVPGRKRKNRKLKVGTKFAIGNSSVVPSIESNFYEKMFSWEGGLFLRWNIFRKLYLQPELLYHRQAYKNTVSEILTKENIHHSGRAQALLGYSPFGAGLYAHAGPYYERKFSTIQKSIEGKNNLIATVSDFPEMNSETEPYLLEDFGYILGGSLNFGRGSFALGLQYSKSLNNLLNDAYWQGDETNENLELKNRSLLFYIQKSF